MKRSPGTEADSAPRLKRDIENLDLQALYMEYLKKLEKKLSAPDADLTELGIFNPRCMKKVCK
ncbi:MAG: hypothetical protein GF411_10575 [Candidatus Lokiarchaeota archaeon]|nr:hypothetical protein [Candidatus Lokiarchaeota archaeon]